MQLQQSGKVPSLCVCSVLVEPPQEPSNSEPPSAAANRAWQQWYRSPFWCTYTGVICCCGLCSTPPALPSMLKCRWTHSLTFDAGLKDLKAALVYETTPFWGVSVRSTLRSPPAAAFTHWPPAICLSSAPGKLSLLTLLTMSSNPQGLRPTTCLLLSPKCANTRLRKSDWRRPSPPEQLERRTFEWIR